jgi:hypothetical protein
MTKAAKDGPDFTPDVLAAFLKAGYRWHGCRDPWVYTRVGKVVHDNMYLYKRKDYIGEDGRYGFDIRVVLVDLSSVVGIGSLGVSFVCEMKLDGPDIYTLERMSFDQDVKDLLAIEATFERAYRAMFIHCPF